MTLKRVFASVFFVIFACLALPTLTSPALAQARGPIAAPTGEPATTQELGAPSAAPTTMVDASGLAPIGGGGSFSIVESFIRADIIVKSVMVLLLLGFVAGTLNVLRSAGLVKPGPLGPPEPPERG